MKDYSEEVFKAQFQRIVKYLWFILLFLAVECSAFYCILTSRGGDIPYYVGGAAILIATIGGRLFVEHASKITHQHDDVKKDFERILKKLGKE